MRNNIEIDIVIRTFRWDRVQIAFNRLISILFEWLNVPCFPIRLALSLLGPTFCRTPFARTNPTDRAAHQPAHQLDE